MKNDKKGNSQIEIKCAYTDLVPIGDIKPHPQNPNKHPPKQIALLARMMRRVGMRSPLAALVASPTAATGCTSRAASSAAANP